MHKRIFFSIFFSNQELSLCSVIAGYRG